MPPAIAAGTDGRAGVSRAAAAALAVAFVLSRLPLLPNGYGSDPDAWRNVVAALHTRVVGHYVPSRVPGFPLFEALLAALVPCGWIASNAAAALAGGWAALSFARILERRGRPVLWPLIGFAFGAPLWVHTTQTMDYAFGLAFFLAAYDAALARRAGLAGLLLALATGCRATYVLTLPALLVIPGSGPEPRRALARCAAGYGLAALALFMPVLLSPEARELSGHLARHAALAHVTGADWVPVARGAVVYLFGKPAAVLAALGMVLALLLRRGPVRSGREARAAGIFEGLCALPVGGFFLLIPYEDAYLLPILPLALIALAGRLPRGLLVATMAAMALTPLVEVDVARHRVVRGRLFEEIARRREDMAEARTWIGKRPDHPTAYVIGRFGTHRLAVLDRSLEITDAGWAPFYKPGIALRAPGGRVAFAEDLLPAQRDSLTRDGWSIEPSASPDAP